MDRGTGISTNRVSLSDNSAEKGCRICLLCPEQDVTVMNTVCPVLCSYSIVHWDSQLSKATDEALGHLKNYPSPVVQHLCGLYNSKLLPNNHI